MDDVLEFVLKLIASIVIVLVLIPVVWILATPFILVGAAFASESYFPAVGKAYRRTASAWSDWGIILIDF